MLIKVVPKTKAQLLAIANPERANEPEALPWVLYDTQAFTSASTTRLEFFTTLQSNKSLGNMESAGQLPDPQFFEVHSFGLDIFQGVSTAAGGVAGALDDVQKILFGDAPTTGADAGRWTFNMSNKNYGPFPLTFLHASGGPTGFGWGTFTAEESIQYANNSIFDGGFRVNGALVIPPKVGFSVVLEWGNPVALAASPAALRLWMAGVLHRRVL